MTLADRPEIKTPAQMIRKSPDPLRDGQSIPASLALEQLPRMTREEYVDRFGIQPAPWDSSRALQSWFDAGADPGAPYRYRTFKDGQVVDRVIPGAYAATPNLTGPYIFPAYVLKPTTALVLFDGVGQQMPAEWLTSAAEAQELAREIEGDIGVEITVRERTPLPIQTFDYGTETRRVHELVGLGSPPLAGRLLRDRSAVYGHGVGSPGHWDLRDTQLLWVPEPQNTGAEEAFSKAAAPVPCRDLVEGERAVDLGFFGIASWHIQRGDVKTPGVGGLSSPQDAILQRLGAALPRLEEFLDRMGV